MQDQIALASPTSWLEPLIAAKDFYLNKNGLTLKIDKQN